MDEQLCKCGHEHYYHSGDGSFFNRKGCAVTYCKCKKFEAA